MTQIISAAALGGSLLLLMGGTVAWTQSSPAQLVEQRQEVMKSLWPSYYQEMARVVRPEGRVVVLEITVPRRPPLSKFFSVWFDRIVPALGNIAGGSSKTYKFTVNFPNGTAAVDNPYQGAQSTLDLTFDAVQS